MRRSSRALTRALVGLVQIVKLLLDENLSPSIAVALCKGDLLRDEQERVVRDAIAAIEAEITAGRDMVNRALRISVWRGKQFETTPPG